MVNKEIGPRSAKADGNVILLYE
jgi:hypothetical protein